MKLILTGPRGVGKTTICDSVARISRNLHHSVGGVISPATYDAMGQKTGFAAQDLSSGECWPLGRIGDTGDGPRIGPYTLESAGLARCFDAIVSAPAAPTDLVVVDEIGPLELFRGEGFAPILHSLPLDGPERLLVVVRPSLVSLFMQTVDRRDWLVFAASEDNRTALSHQIARVLWACD